MKLHDKLSWLYIQSHVMYRKRHRRRLCKSDLAKKRGHLTPLDGNQRNEIIGFWQPYRKVDAEMQWFEFYNTFCSDKRQLKYYIPDPIMYLDIDLKLTDPARSHQLDDKNLYDLYFKGAKLPRTIVRKCNGVILDGDYQPLSLEQAMDLCHKETKIIKKPSRNSQGGKGIKIMELSATTDDELSQQLKEPSDYIIQEVLSQHESINNIYDQSINTVRIMSLLMDGNVYLLSSVLRMGRDGSHVDNASKGGIVCGINQDGTLKEYAYNTKGDRWSQHPQGPVFKGLKIAGYDKCCALVKSLAGRFCTTSKLISWDLAIDKDGEPVIIEVNLSFGEVDFQQMCNGPIFGDLTERVLTRIYHSVK
jgi:hypothetical protein